MEWASFVKYRPLTRVPNTLKCILKRPMTVRMHLSNVSDEEYMLYYSRYYLEKGLNIYCITFYLEGSLGSLDKEDLKTSILETEVTKMNTAGVNFSIGKYDGSEGLHWKRYRHSGGRNWSFFVTLILDVDPTPEHAVWLETMPQKFEAMLTKSNNGDGQCYQRSFGALLNVASTLQVWNNQRSWREPRGGASDL